MSMIIFTAGVVAGVVATIAVVIIRSNDPIGTLRVIDSDESSEPYLFLEIKKSPHELSNLSKVVLQIQKETYTQK